VVVIAGETGSGKTTQLPKLCLAAGRGVRRADRLHPAAAHRGASMARRVAEELKSPLGALVGFAVRFQDQVGEDSHIKFMTDGILLAEIQSDRALRRYDTLIIDEAHERSLNIDFLLGYLKRLLPRRPDLKVIVTSATIDTERFARHFGGAPVISVEGRGYPVEVRYRPIEGDREERGDDGLYRSIAAAAEELQREDPRGDVLVFLPGEREIRDAHKALERASTRNRSPAAVCAAELGGDRTRCSARAAAAHRAGDQRRRDLDHRAAHPLRDRSRHRRASSATASAPS
jgi:ATP-dependent helicase HrpA